ncbi:MAG: carboxypeptidase-like regulatory domain-containing protein, partial [Terriglobales bacterium]
MKKLSLLLTLVVALVAPVSVLAQRVTVRGHITGDNGKPLAGAEIVLVNKDNGQKFTMKTDKNGDFVNIGVTFGAYHMTVNKDGKALYNEDI